MVCRAHPLSIAIEDGILISASVSGECQEAAKIVMNHTVKLSEYFSKEILHANAVISSYMDSMFSQSEGLIWLYDLKSEKWKRVTIEAIRGL